MSSLSYYLYLDDERLPSDDDLPEDWKRANLFIVRNAADFIRTVRSLGTPTFVSFDHDLHPEHYANQQDIDYSGAVYRDNPCGWHCAQWLIEHLKEKGAPVPKWNVHSLSAEGSRNIRRLMADWEDHEN